MKKPFTTPFWFMLIFSILYVVLSLWIFVRYLHIGWNVFSAYPIEFTWLWLRMPVLFLLEALIYWRIRYRNKFRHSSWWHCLVTLFAYLSAYLLLPLMVFLHILRYKGQRFLVSRDSVLLFLLIVAHLFFIEVVIKSFRNKPKPPDESSSDHLLDNIVS